MVFNADLNFPSLFFIFRNYRFISRFYCRWQNLFTLCQSDFLQFIIIHQAIEAFPAKGWFGGETAGEWD